MISGTFHAMSQEWRYFSREKSIVHTLHLAQLSPSATGASVFITPAPPTGTAGGNFSSRPTFSVPDLTPHQGIDWTQLHNNIVPIWMAGDGPFAAGPPYATGTYGPWSGTFFWNPALPFDQAIGWEWPITGGTFLVIGGASSPVQSSAFDMMAPVRQQLFISPNHGDSSDVRMDMEWGIYLQGGGWNNQMFFGEVVNGHVGSAQSLIIQHVPLHNAIGSHSLPSTVDGFDGYSSQALTIIRLGP